MRPPIRVTLRDDVENERARTCLIRALGDHARFESADGETSAPGLRLVTIEQAARSAAADRVVVVGSSELPALVELLSDRPWLNHVVPTRALDGGLVGAVLHRSLAHLLGDGASPCDLPQLNGARQVLIRDSDDRPRIIEQIDSAARAHGVTGPLQLERIRDVAEEIITNALYDGPVERGRTPLGRETRVELDEAEACTIWFGVVDDTFLLRMCDPFGSLGRERVFEVLRRCAAQHAVALDTSRGGAGLGLWRIFSSAALVVIHVLPLERTDLLVGIDLKRRGRSDERSLHLFFEPPRGATGK